MKLHCEVHAALVLLTRFSAFIQPSSGRTKESRTYLISCLVKSSKSLYLSVLSTGKLSKGTFCFKSGLVNEKTFASYTDDFYGDLFPDEAITGRGIWRNWCLYDRGNEIDDDIFMLDWVVRMEIFKVARMTVLSLYFKNRVALREMESGFYGFIRMMKVQF